MIQWEIKEQIVELQLQHPPCNEIGLTLLEELERFLEEFDLENTKALILYSTLPSGFCAGADLKELYHQKKKEPSEGQEQKLSQFLDRIHHVMNTLDLLPCATLAVIHGVCFGGGLELALTCDLRIAEQTARFCFPELRLGLIPGFGGIPRLKREVSQSLVHDLIFTGRSINAKKALQVGLVHHLVPRNEGLQVARQMAQQSARFDRTAFRTAKAFIKKIPESALAEEKQHFLRLAQRPTLNTALEQFVQSTDLRPYL
jgi:enoyl-CoA hydratase/carnithine racemase